MNTASEEYKEIFNAFFEEVNLLEKDKFRKEIMDMMLDWTEFFKKKNELDENDYISEKKMNKIIKKVYRSKVIQEYNKETGSNLEELVVVCPSTHHFNFLHFHQIKDIFNYLQRHKIKFILKNIRLLIQLKNIEENKYQNDEIVKKILDKTRKSIHDFRCIEIEYKDEFKKKDSPVLFIVRHACIINLACKLLKSMERKIKFSTHDLNKLKFFMKIENESGFGFYNQYIFEELKNTYNKKGKKALHNQLKNLEDNFSSLNTKIFPNLIGYFYTIFVEIKDHFFPKKPEIILEELKKEKMAGYRSFENYIELIKEVKELNGKIDPTSFSDPALNNINTSKVEEYMFIK
ncbi:MAG: hypothetical protein LBJ09_02020 [Clostridiales bacterium]|jgi:hypothetical protein|nr:hypothetical protein [Clostridiales bacterium]